MAKRQERIVIDTNLFISFLISDSFSRLDKYIRSYKVKLLFSDELLNEFLSVISRPKLKKYFSEKDIVRLMENIQNYAEFIDIKSSVTACRDKKDNFLLELCVDGKADYLLTGDQDLLVLKRFGKTRIIKIAEFIQSR